MIEEDVLGAMGEVARLVENWVGGQVEGPGGVFEGGEIDICGEVLFAWAVEGVDVFSLFMEGPEGASGAGGVVERCLVEAVVDPDGQPSLENFGQGGEE